MSRRRSFAVMAGVLLWAGCAEVSGPGGDGRLAVNFATVRSGGAGVAESGGVGPAGLTIVGRNGTLQLEDVRMIVAEFELELAESPGGCDSSGRGNPCREFEAAPAFVRLPLESGAVPAIREPVPAGVYEELEFEVERLDGDGGSGRGSRSSLLSQIRGEIPDWPGSASLMVKGTFTPAGGRAVPFRVFLDAEIEIELEFEPPLVVEGADLSVTVEVDPRLWFGRPDGTVVDLSAFDFESTRRVPQFSFELERGFTGVRRDRRS